MINTSVRTVMASAVTAAVGVALLAGCNANDDAAPDKSGEETSAAEDAVPESLATHPGASADGMDGTAVSGTISGFTSCVVITTEEGKKVIPVFPAAEVTAQDGSVTYTDDTGTSITFKDGDKVDLAGTGPAPQDQKEDSTIPSACPTDLSLHFIAAAYPEGDTE